MYCVTDTNALITSFIPNREGTEEGEKLMVCIVVVNLPIKKQYTCDNMRQCKPLPDKARLSRNSHPVLCTDNVSEF